MVSHVYINWYVLAALGLGLLGLLLIPLYRDDKESGQRVLYEARGMIIEWIFPFISDGNLPFWRVSLYEPFIVIAFVHHLHIDYAEIVRAELKSSFKSIFLFGAFFFFRKRLTLEFQGDSRTRTLHIYLRHPERVMNILRNKGVPISPY